MAQTMKGKTGTLQQKNQKPGQRQQERLRRIARRRRRWQIIWSIVAVVVIAAIASLSFWQYQRITAQQTASRIATATAVANLHIHATATAITRDCFISSTASDQVPAIYTAKATPAAGPASSPPITGTPVTQKDGLKYVDMKVGTGPASKKGNTISVEYAGWIASTCKKFDSSFDHGGQSFPFKVGLGQVIKGFDEGLLGIKAGGIRRIYIPAPLAYGAQSPQGSNIPPNSNLIFDVIVTSVK
ncbi:MAG: FKBP-type peptidyl-prolyl cis-trans isomerase [Chloroflexota bacterium]|nr:FKBP-type peptidyl-prolyl cis-trans isomerase [Chloroflexota bacterium]